MKRIKLPSYLKDISAPLATMVLLTASFAPFDLAFLSFVAYLPLVLGFARTENRLRFTICTVIATNIFWLFNIYWLTNIIVIGWLGASIILGLFSIILIKCLKIATARKYQFWLVLPIAITGIEFIYRLPFGGFQWHLLGHSLYRQTTLIQIADITGVAGISFLIAMVNGIICDILFRKSIRGLKFPLAICLITIALVITYGQYRINTEPPKFTKSPLIASIQPNIPSTVRSEKYEGFNILDNVFDIATDALKSEAKLIVMPETIIPSAINQGFLEYTALDSEPRQYAQKLRDFTADNNLYLMAGATALDVGKVDEQYQVTNQYNSAFLYSPNSSLPPARYDKIHLVPFGEYIPARNIQSLRRLFLYFNPYSYDYTLTAGKDLTRFEAQLQEQDWSFSAIICYEDTDDVLCSRLSYSEEEGKADWILNISNDGWYVWYDDGEIKPSIELAQRTAISAFRAVENRITLIRSVNTGISCKIDPLGRIIDGYQAGNLPEKAFDRQAVEGWFADKADISPTITIFTKYGNFFSRLCGAALLILILPWHRFTPKKPKAA